MEDDNILVLENITKNFPGVKALDKVHLKVKKGEIHALCGENGAGKSTLMKIISGAQHYTSGSMIFEGKKVQFKNTKKAQESGIAMIYQEFNLISELTVAENLFIGRCPVNKYGKINWKELYSKSESLLKKVGLDISSKKKISELMIGETQMIEIAKCLLTNAKLIIMDEPTASLTEKETENLFEIIRNLKKHGISIIYISHRLDEIFQITDRITVLRDGKYIDTKKTYETNHDELVRIMVGKDITELYPKREKVLEGNSPIILEAKSLKQNSKISKVSFNLKKGEILGLAGLLGAGNIYLGKMISGYYGSFKGKIILNNKEIIIEEPSDALKVGISCVSDDRKSEGLILTRSVKENITLASMKEIVNHWPLACISKTKEKKIVNKQIKRLNIKVSSSNQMTKNLSGGNQQKVVFGKMLETKPKVLILNEPTRGIDIGAKAEIYQIIRKLSDRGIGVIIATSELTELIGMCDRVLVMRKGEIVKELENKKLSQEKILFYASGGVINE